MSVLATCSIWLGIILMVDRNRAEAYKSAIQKADSTMSPFIQSISLASYESVTMINRLNSMASINFVKDYPEERFSKKKEILKDVGEALRECSCAMSFDIYDADTRILSRIYLDKDGAAKVEETKESGLVRDMFIRGSLLNEGEIYMSRFYETADPLTGAKVNVISYVSPIRSREGKIIGLGGLTVPVNQFFSGFEKQSIPKGLFVVDNEGNYLWHSDKSRVLEILKKKDSSFFADFSKSYPDILGGRGELRIWDGALNDYLEVRPVHPAFEVIVDGVSRKINAQETPNANKVWFIGYEE